MYILFVVLALDSDSFIVIVLNFYQRPIQYAEATLPDGVQRKSTNIFLTTCPIFLFFQRSRPL